MAYSDYVEPNLPDYGSDKYNQKAPTINPDLANIDYTGDSQLWKTGYSGAEQSAIERLLSIIKYGGYSPEQKQAMLNAGMTPINQEATAANTAATNSAYARGLGQSGVLSRSYGQIEGQKQDALTKLVGGIEAQSAAAVQPAIESIQQGVTSERNAKIQYEQIKADVAEKKAALATQLGMKQADIEMLMKQLNDTLYMSDADRAVKMAEIQNTFNLNEDQMKQAKETADADREANFWANLLGGLFGAGGSILGSFV